MSTSFSRSIHTLQQESTRRTSFFLIVIALFILLWLGWFLRFPLTEWETADTAVIQSNGRVQATFPPDAQLYLHSGQSAQLRLDDFPWTEYGSVSVTVVQVDNTIRDGQVVVELRPLPEQHNNIPLQRDLTGSLFVEIGQLTPAQLLWQTVSQQANQLDTSQNPSEETVP